MSLCQRARKVPLLCDEDEAAVIVYDEVYLKVNIRFMDNNCKEALWGQIAKEVNHTAVKIMKWFDTRRTGYRILTKSKRSGQSALQWTDI